jgi:phenylpropionate dioxygenase-like ring-hydroxylating dioxygenase large terminal subunit
MPLAKYVRPQKHKSWFNVIPERDYRKLKSSRVPFLDSFVTVEASPASGQKYVVRYEGVQPMLVTLRYGFICVWFGDDLETPDWPFPTLFERSYGQEFFVSEPKIFQNTNLLDLIENNGDQLHFKTVHQWKDARIWGHEYTDRVFRLKMKGTIQYGLSADHRLKRRMATLLPLVSYTQDLAFHGPGFGAGAISTGVGLDAQLVLAFTPVGEHDLKLHLAASADLDFLPRWVQRLSRRVGSLHDVVSWFIARAGIDDTDGDYRIWRHKRSLSDPRLLAGEGDIIKIREWMSQYYFADFEQPAQPVRDDADRRWVVLGPQRDIKPGRVASFRAAGEDLIAFRTSAGDARVFEAHCPHQGAHLGHGGVLKDDCVVCPFHHFCFNPDGAFLGMQPQGKPKPTMQLNRIEHRVSNGIVEVLV